MSWKRLSQAVGVEIETMMLWERGVTKDPPIGKVLLFAREVGILDLTEIAEIAEIVTGKPWPSHVSDGGVQIHRIDDRA